MRPRLSTKLTIVFCSLLGTLIKRECATCTSRNPLRTTLARRADRPSVRRCRASSRHRPRPRPPIPSVGGGPGASMVPLSQPTGLRYGRLFRRRQTAMLHVRGKFHSELLAVPPRHTAAGATPSPRWRIVRCAMESVHFLAAFQSCSSVARHRDIPSWLHLNVAR